MSLGPVERAEPMAGIRVAARRTAEPGSASRKSVFLTCGAGPGPCGDGSTGRRGSGTENL
jgi:hypothetical protein